MISEKTLELNITHEILSLGDHLDTLIRIAALGPWPPFGHHWNLLLNRMAWRAPSYASGLTLTDENRRGWDVRIQYPTNGHTTNHALFLQFKAGKHRNFSRLAGSAFHGTRARREPYCCFGFNNNSDKNQHIVLRQLSAQPRLQGAVAYVFPRIPNAATLKACIGHLIHVTSFISVADLDAEITRCGVVVNVGDTHEFRTSYVNPLIQEVRSEPTTLGSVPESTGHIVGEILACRAYRALRENRETANLAGIRSTRSFFWKNLFKAFEIEIAKYFGVNAEAFERTTENKLEPSEKESLFQAGERFNAFEEEYIQGIGEGLDEEESLRGGRMREKLYSTAAASLSIYRTFISNPDWTEMPIPKPPARVVATLPNQGLDVRFKETSEIGSLRALERVLKSVSYQVF